MENEVRNYFGLSQREKYNNVWDVPFYYINAWYLRPGEFDRKGGYRTLSGPASKWRP